MTHWTHAGWPGRPETDPGELYRMRDGLAAVDLLGAAISHLGFFGRLAEEPGTLEAICVRFGIHERPTDVLLTLALALGLVDRDEAGVHSVSLRGREFLLSGSPWDMTAYYGAMKDRLQTLDMVKVLRTGKPANWGSYEREAWAKSMEREEFAGPFTAAMDCRGVLLGPELAAGVDLGGRHSLLDVGGGSGVYACACVARNPGLRGTVFEKPPVDAIARKAVALRGFEPRVGVVAGDMFGAEWPGGHDVHLLSNVLHDWGVGDVGRLLARSAEALEPGGILVIHEAFLAPDKRGPLAVAEYSALLMSICDGRCYSTQEIRGFAERAGFEWSAEGPTAIGRGWMVLRKG